MADHRDRVQARSAGGKISPIIFPEVFFRGRFGIIIPDIRIFMVIDDA